jgi:hypothetical protein
MIGTMNLFTWCGILGSAASYGVCAKVFETGKIAWTFAVLAALILPVAVWYRPRAAELSDD